MVMTASESTVNSLKYGFDPPKLEPPIERLLRFTLIVSSRSTTESSLTVMVTEPASPIVITLRFVSVAS